MANKLYEESDVQAIATAIRAKNGTSTTYKVSQMAAAINALPTGTTISNGVIQELKHSLNSTTAIPANKFIEFAYFLGTGISSYNNLVSAQRLSENTFVVLTTARISSAYKLSATVCTISNNELQCGTTSYFDLSGSTGGSETYISQISNNKFLIFYCVSSTIYCVPATLSNNALQFSTATLIVSGASTFKAELVDTDTAVVCYSKSGLKAVVVKYENNGITVGTETTLATGTYVANYLYMCKVAASKAVITHTYGGDNYYKLYAIAISVSGTTITVGTDTQVSSTYYSSPCNSCFALEDNKIIVMYRNGHNFTAGASYRIGTLNGLSITFGTNQNLSSGQYAIGYSTRFTKISENKYFATSYDSNMDLYTMFFTIDSSNKMSFYKYDAFCYTNRNSANYSFPVAVSENTVIVITKDAVGTYRTSTIGYAEFTISGTTYSVYKKVQLPTTTIYGNKKIDGFTLEQITTTTPGDVYVFNG